VTPPTCVGSWLRPADLDGWDRERPHAVRAGIDEPARAAVSA